MEGRGGRLRAASRSLCCGQVVAGGVALAKELAGCKVEAALVANAMVAVFAVEAEPLQGASGKVVGAAPTLCGVLHVHLGHVGRVVPQAVRANHLASAVTASRAVHLVGGRVDEWFVL